MEAFESFSRRQIVRMRRAVRPLLDGTRFSEADDLIHEAMHRVLRTRACPADVDFEAFLYMVCKSLVEAERTRAEAQSDVSRRDESERGVRRGRKTAARKAEGPAQKRAREEREWARHPARACSAWLPSVAEREAEAPSAEREAERRARVGRAVRAIERARDELAGEPQAALVAQLWLDMVSREEAVRAGIIGGPDYDKAAKRALRRARSIFLDGD